jgi:AcrR family transcriptional regulator
VGRPREHDERTGRALLDAAERAVDTEGTEALSIRLVAAEVGTTTRAVYSVFGSKHGLLVALGSRASEILGTALRALPTTDDPRADLVEAGIVVFRCFALDHPSLFGIGVQMTSTARRSEFSPALSHAFVQLEARVARLGDAGVLGPRTVRDAATAFHALCEGLAAVELRGSLRPGEEERLWRDALSTLVYGFASSAATVPSASPTAAPKKRYAHSSAKRRDPANTIGTSG